MFIIKFLMDLFLGTPTVTIDKIVKDPIIYPDSSEMPSQKEHESMKEDTNKTEMSDAFEKAVEKKKSDENVIQQDKCANCDLKKKDDREKHLENSINEVFEELMAMPEKDLKAKLNTDEIEEKLYICPNVDECTLDIKETCIHKESHKWNEHCPNYLVTNEGGYVENLSCPIGGCIVYEPTDDKNDECKPETCLGECMGNGNCYVAVDWRDKIKNMFYNSNYMNNNYSNGFIGVPHKKNKKKKHDKHKGKIYRIHRRNKGI